MEIFQNITPFNCSSPNNIEYIVLHDTGNKGDTPEGNCKFFADAFRNRSASYFVGDYRIGQCVLDSKGAWHVGDGYNKNGINNHNSLGVEMCNDANGDITAATEANTLELVLAKMKEHNVPLEKVVRHFDASGKICPESWSGDGWARWFAFKAKLAQRLMIPAPVRPVVAVSVPTQAPLNFSFPNNARVVGTDLYERDANGNKVPGHYASNGEPITVLDVSYSKQLALIEWGTPSGVRRGYVRNVCIQYFNQGQWHNGRTPETVYGEDGTAIGRLDPRETASPLYRKNGRLHVVYNTISKGTNTKSGYVNYNGGFTKF